eukprot:TRINITY_DN12045_c0_g1_i3.p1 TRINITY_DN12045_c0_g1~~TRINITY_DN12045_c0_g1_i3.p1  ORF type:complete len:508 (-),score=21.23 TRINITY_DN12045_c0_g1_i3:678-2135(-)
MRGYLRLTAFLSQQSSTTVFLQLQDNLSSSLCSNLTRFRDYFKDILKGILSMGGGDGSLIWSAIQPVIKIALMCGVGAFLGYKGIIVEWGEKLLGNLLMKVFIPCLMIAKLGASLSLANLMNWWPAAANVALSTVVGGLLGWIAARVLRVPYNFRNHVICSCGLGNVGNIPLVFVPEVIKGSKSVFGDVSEDLSMAYIMLGVWVAVFFLFSWGYKMLSPTPTLITLANKKQTNLAQVELSQIESGSCSASEYFPGLDANTQGNQYLENCNSTDDMIQEHVIPFSVQIDQNPEKHQYNKYQFDIRVQKIRKFIEKEVLIYVNAPIIATIISLLIGIIRPIQWALFTEGAPLQIVGSTIRSFGDATIPCMMLLLGSTVVRSPQFGQVSARTIIGVCVTRLIIVPLIGTMFLYFVIRQGWIYMPDRVLPFVMLAQWIVPTAINLESIATVHQNQHVQLSIVLFWQYLFSLFTMPAFAYLFLIIIQQIN